MDKNYYLIMGDTRETLGQGKRDIGGHWETKEKLGDIKGTMGDSGRQKEDTRETMGDIWRHKRRHTGLMYQDERKTTLNGQKSSIFLKRLAIEFDRRGKLKIGERRPTIFIVSDKLARVPGTHYFRSLNSPDG